LCLKFRYHGNQGQSWQNLSDVIQEHDCEKSLLGTSISLISYFPYKLSYRPFSSQISLPWQRGLVAVEFVRRHSIARPRKPPVIRKDLGDISYIGRVMANFIPNFVAIATGVGRSRICQASFNSPTPITPVIRKDLRDISYIGRVIADFVPNFVTMATGVGRSRIFLASINSPTPKTPCYTQRSRGYLLNRPSYGRFCPKFRRHGNKGHLGVNLNYAIK